MFNLTVLNAFWFTALLSAHFVGGKVLSGALLAAIAVGALYALTRPFTDPMAWLYYVAFSLLAFWIGMKFKNWVFGKSIKLQKDISQYTLNLEERQKVLDEKTSNTDYKNRRANDIHYLYEKMKDMSKSLDRFEAFLIYSEAFYRQYPFEKLTLSLFPEEGQGLKSAREIFVFKKEDFTGFFDKNDILAHRDKYTVKNERINPRVSEMIFRTRKPQDYYDNMQSSHIMAFPILAHEKIVGILMIMGISNEKPPAAVILTERFLAEMERIELYEAIEALAITDGLTGAYVRRHLMERIEGEIARSKKFGFEVSFLMIDVDHFKRFNDKYGHLVGDVILRQVAETVRKSVRELDLVGRYGGEEFGVLLIETGKDGALFVAERIRSAVEARLFRAYDESLKATVSIGVSTFFRGSTIEAPALIESADQAMYEAKRLGRNRVQDALSVSSMG